MANDISTKDRILSMLSAGNKTMSEISLELGLSKATVSQHISELKQMGAIEDADPNNTHKWKYYKLNPNFVQNTQSQANIMANRVPKRIFYYIIGLALVLSAALYLISPHNSAVVSSQPNAAQAQITGQISSQTNQNAQLIEEENLTQFLNVTQVSDLNMTPDQSLVMAP